MAELKTKLNEADVTDFINAFADNEQKRKDAFELLALMERWTGFKPKMWGASMIGFGSYHYKSEKSRQEGDWPLVGFSPRKAAISLYVYSGTPEQEALLIKLGKFKMGKGCIYIKRLSDIDHESLHSLVNLNISHLQARYGNF